MTSNLINSLKAAGTPSLPEGYTYSFNVADSGNLYGYLHDPAGNPIHTEYLWIGELFNGTEQLRTWSVQDLATLAKRLYELLTPPETPIEKWSPNIANFLDTRFIVS